MSETQKRTSRWQVVLAASIAASCFFNPETSAAEPPLVVQVSPKAVSQGNPFTVTIRIGSDSEPVADLLGVGFQVHFDGSALGVVSIQPGPFLDDGSTIDFEHLDNTSGFAAYSISRTAAPGASNTGIVAILNFMVNPKAKENTSYPIALEDLEAVDSDGSPITLTPVHSSIYVERPVPNIASSWTRIKLLLQ